MIGDQSDIARGIKARQLQVLIEDAVTARPHDPADATHARMAEANFDHAPVLVRGRVAGLVRRDDLAKPGINWVSDARKDIHPELLVSAEAGITDLLGGLESAPFLFVLDGRRISGFVTPADLNRQPARSYFFLLLAELELGLAEILRRSIGPDQALDALDPARRDELRTHAAEARAANLENDWITYFYLGEVLGAIGSHPECLHILGVRKRSLWEKKTEQFASVRNAVVHPVRDMVDAKRRPGDLRRVDKNLRDLVALTGEVLKR